MNSENLELLILNLTNRCNLKCHHCWLSPEYSKEKITKALPVEALTNAINESRKLGLKNVKLTGGEPFLYPDIYKLIAYLNDNSIFFSIETNGTLLTSENINVLKSKYLTRISISIENFEEKEHVALRGTKNSFKQVLSTLNLFRENNIQVQIISMLTKPIIRDFSKFLDFLEDFKIVDSLKLNPLMPIGRGVKLFDTARFPTIQEIILFNDNLNANRFKSGKINIYLDIPLAFRKFTDISKFNFSVCPFKNLAGVLENGDISFCGIGSLSKEYIFGNIEKDSISEIWVKNEKWKDIRNKMVTGLKGICAECIFKAVCLGGCRAIATFQNDDICAPFWFCEKANQKNLFPRSRKC